MTKNFHSGFEISNLHQGGHCFIGTLLDTDYEEGIGTYATLITASIRDSVGILTYQDGRGTYIYNFYGDPKRCRYKKINLSTLKDTEYKELNYEINHNFDTDFINILFYE